MALTRRLLLWQLTRVAVLGLGALGIMKGEPLPSVHAACPDDGCGATHGHTYCATGVGNESSCSVVGSICIPGPPCN